MVSKLLAVIAVTVVATLPSHAQGHGDVTPQAVDTRSLPQLGEALRPENPYRRNAEAIRIGASAYNQNCARCHGLEAVSGGIAPDLRKLDVDADTDQYFIQSVRNGKTRNGAVYMPPFKDILSQEAVWSIKSYLETRREP